MRFVCLSDTHCKLHKVPIPEGDVLLYAGDLSSLGTKNQLYRELRTLAKQRHKYIVLIAGNHDKLAEQEPWRFHGILKEFPNIIYLEDRAITLGGVKIYGSPWSPFNLPDSPWVFKLPEIAQDRVIRDIWRKIPDDVEVLMTHGPPKGIRDRVMHGRELLGCPYLMARLRQLDKLKLHVFGHIHGGSGVSVLGEVTFVNAAMLDDKYKVVHEPYVIDI